MKKVDVCVDICLTVSLNKILLKWKLQHFGKYFFVCFLLES